MDYKKKITLEFACGEEETTLADTDAIVGNLLLYYLMVFDQTNYKRIYFLHERRKDNLYYKLNALITLTIWLSHVFFF